LAWWGVDPVILKKGAVKLLIIIEKIQVFYFSKHRFGRELLRGYFVDLERDLDLCGGRAMPIEDRADQSEETDATLRDMLYIFLRATIGRSPRIVAATSDT
jgi:hypothetical protein